MKKEKVSMGFAFKIYCKGFAYFFKKHPQNFISNTLYYVLTTVLPYSAIFFSAKLIEELSGEKRADVLWFWVVVSITTTAIISLVRSIVQRWSTIHNGGNQIFCYVDDFYREKTLDMDFCVATKQQTKDLLSQIHQNNSWRGYGFPRVFFIFNVMVESVTSIILSTAMTVTLFSNKMPESAGNLKILDSRIFIVIIILAMLLVTTISSYCSTKSEAIMASKFELMKFGKRLIGYFGYELHNKARSLDMRMNRQEKISELYLFEHNPYSSKSVFGKLAKGKCGVLEGIANCTSSIFTGCVYVFVCLKSLGGAFGVGMVTQYIGAVVLLSSALSNLIQELGSIKNNTPFLLSAFEYLDIKNEMYQGSLTTEKRSDKNYDVEFRNVSFKYPNTEELVLNNLNVKFKVGKKFAVVGENGSGKTTFIKLLCRLYDPTEGEILLNGINIKKYDYQDYINVFSVVFQDFKLLAYSLGQNVGSCVDYNRKKAEKCLVDAGFGERLKTMPKGLDTALYKDLDKNGVEISGGEAQKIALARALYKNSAFIILDEPTAALDPIAESEVYESFNSIVGDKTTIYISHRLSSCKFCDEIMVFNKGKIAEFGTHQCLLNQNGKYTELWQAQAQYYN
ncbi:MAG: ABC transporter ATP-binding protein [Clostridia bacterium]